MAAITQPSFTTGELAPALHARIDLARYYTALKTCRNFIVRPFGGVMNRAGSTFCRETKTSAKKSRLVEFIFSSTQAYALEVGENYIRFIVNGGYVIDGGGNPIEVATPYLEDDLAVLKYIQSADVMTFTHQDYKQRQLNRLSQTSWTLTTFNNVEGPFLDINTNTSKTVYASSTSGTVTLTASADTWTADDIGRLFYLEQTTDETTPRWEVAKTIAAGVIRRAGVSYYRATRSGTTGTVRPSTLEGREADGDPGVAWEYLHSGFGVVKIATFTNARSVTATVQTRLPDRVAIVPTTPKNITNVTNSGAGLVRITIANHGYSTGNYITIASVVGLLDDGTTAWTTQVNGNWIITVVSSSTFDLQNSTWPGGTYTSGGTAKAVYAGEASYKWALEAWGAEEGYPAASIYYQQRQVFGGSPNKPHVVQMSRSAGYSDFGQSNPILDDDALSFEINSEKLQEVRHFIGMQSLIALTSEAAWVIEKNQGEPIPVIKPQDQGGSSHIRPLKIGKKAIYVEDKGGAIRSLGYDFSSDAYEGQDLTMTASHFFKNKTIVDWAYQKVPFRCVWIVMSDGGLLGLTYMPDQEVVGWHRHDTDGFYESVCCIPEGNEDVIYAIVRREIGGVSKRYVERFASRMFSDINDAFFVDCGLSYDGRTVAANVEYILTGGTDWTHEETLTFTTTTDFFTGVSDVGDEVVLYDTTGEALRLTILEYVSAKVVKVLTNRIVPAEFRATTKIGFHIGRDTFSGLGHLEGKTVTIFADGNPQGEAVVTGGVVTINPPGVVVHVGLPIESDIETLNVNIQGQSLQDKVSSVRSVTVLVEDTRGLWAGPDEAHLVEKSPKMSGEYDNPIALETGVMGITIPSKWSVGSNVLIRQKDPLPITILGIIPDVAVGG